MYKLGSIPEIGKFNNEPYLMPNGTIGDIFNPNIYVKTIKNDNIACFIRNTNKHANRNLPPSIYNLLINYCMCNNKHLYIFLDLLPVDIKECEYVHIVNIRENGVLLIDKFIDICNDCYLFVGSASGISEICSTYTYCHVIQWHDNASVPYQQVIKNNDIVIRTYDDLNNTLDNLYG